MNQERKNAAEKALSEATARAYELRADFVATVSAAAIKKRLVDIVALWAYAEYWDDTSWLTEEEIAQATGAEPIAEDNEDGEGDAAFTLQAVTDAIGKTPEKTLLRMIYARLGDCKSEGYFRSYWNSYAMKHEENEKLDRIYALLVKLGYEMSDDEIRTEAHPCIPATNVEPGTVGQRRVEQTGDIKSPVQRQSRTRRKTERNESFDGKIEVGEPCGLIRIVVENIVRSRGSLHREKKPRAKPPMF